MKQPALSFRKMPLGKTAPGRQYIYGEVSLGELQEPFWSGTYVWTPDKYKAHWAAAARRCLAKRLPVLFYTDVGVRASMAYHVVPTATGLLVFEQIFRGHGQPLTREGAARAILREGNRVSCWTAPLASLHSLAAGGLMSTFGALADRPLSGAAPAQPDDASWWNADIALDALTGQRRRMAHPESQFQLEVTAEDEIICRAPRQAEQRIRVDDLASVYVETNNSGHWGSDVWWLLNDDTGTTRVAFPQLATGEDAVLERLRLLPGFEVRGMNSGENARFRCWPSPVT